MSMLNNLASSGPAKNATTVSGSGAAAERTGGPQEQSFHILPHPAKSNNPADLQQNTDDLSAFRANPGLNAFNTPGPVIPNKEVQKNIPPALSREELKAKAAELK